MRDDMCDVKLTMDVQKCKIQKPKGNFPRFLYLALLIIYRWFNITNILPHSPDDGSLEPKRYSVDFASQ